MPLADEHYIARCIALAERGRPAVQTNPLVGCVIVHGDRILAEGYHARRGESHAEINALRQVRPEDIPLLPESRIYVSLEPCDHHGQTPPCSLAIIEAGISEVIFGMTDPNHAASGGAQRLEHHGIKVSSGYFIDEIATQNQHFLLHHREQRPYITLKWAESADGFIGRHDRRISLTGALANRYTHRLRAQHDGILVGARTARVDDPQLTTRLVTGSNPRAVIITHDQDTLPRDLALLQCEDTIILDDIDDLSSALHTLCQDYHMGWLMVEGGRQVLQQFIDQGYYDRAHRLIAPVHLRSGVSAPQIPLAPHRITSLGSDRLVEYLNEDV